LARGRKIRKIKGSRRREGSKVFPAGISGYTDGGHQKILIFGIDLISSLLVGG